jgi:type IV pilus assembly protein PilV
MAHIHYQGFTLIEVLISLVLLSFIVLGFDVMELYSLRATRTAYYFYVATNQFISMTERLRALGQYDGINEQITIWNLQNKQLLPAGEGTVTGHFPHYTLTIYWGGFPHICNQIHLGQSGCIQQSITL